MDFSGNPVVWITDDDEAVRESLQALLEAAGYRVRTFASGPEILRAVKDDTPDCLILDLAMPEMDGLGVMGALGQMGIRLPTVIVTAHGNEQIKTRARQAGAICMLDKPAQAEELFAVLERAIQKPSNQAGRM